MASRPPARLSWPGRGRPAGDRLLLEEQFGAGRPLYQLRQAVQPQAVAAGLSGPCGARLLDLAWMDFPAGIIAE